MLHNAPKLGSRLGNCLLPVGREAVPREGPKGLAAGCLGTIIIVRGGEGAGRGD